MNDNWKCFIFERKFNKLHPTVLSVLACGCVWVCGWDADFYCTWHSATANISVRTLSCWFCWFFYNGSSVDIRHTEKEPQLHKQLFFSPVCVQSTAFDELTLLALALLSASIVTFHI